jgi:hypothetical protein
MLAVTGRVSEEFSSRIWHSSRHSKPKHQNWVSQVPLLAPGKARTSIAKAFFVMLSGAKRSRNIRGCFCLTSPHTSTERLAHLRTVYIFMPFGWGKAPCMTAAVSCGSTWR